MSGDVFFNPIPYHSQRFILIPIRNPRFSLVLFPFQPNSHRPFPFLPASVPIRVDIFCQFIVALLLIVFWVAEIIKVKDTTLPNWWAMTVECVTVRRSSGEADVAPLTRAGSLPLTANRKMWSFHSLPFLSSHSHSNEISLAIPILMGFPWDLRDPWESQYRLISSTYRSKLTVVPVEPGRTQGTYDRGRSGAYSPCRFYAVGGCTLPSLHVFNSKA